MAIVNEREASDWIASLRRFGTKPGLARVDAVLSALGHPETQLSFYHVAGTNGKGSVCAMLATMLEAIGNKVGLYTSPGLGGFNGRMTINGHQISDEAFANYANVVKNAMAQLPSTVESLTEFEVLTVIAILHFCDKQVDAVVWETGLGGRHDATNVVHPVVTAITNVSMDHVEILGPTLADIASDKAGIMKPGVPMVTAATGEAYRIIEQVAKNIKSPVTSVGCDVSMTRMPLSEGRETGFYRGLKRDAGGVSLSLFGRHQLRNAAVAMAMLERSQANLSTDHWRIALKALKTVRWPSRFEVFAGRPGPQPVVLDGAHNPDAAVQLRDALLDFAQAYDVKGKWSMVFGVFADKDMHPMLHTLIPFARDVTVCRPNHARGADANLMADVIRRSWPDLTARVIEDVETAVITSSKQGTPLLIWGNLYMAEDARKAIVKMEMDYWI